MRLPLIPQGLVLLALLFPGSEAFSTVPLWQRPSLSSHKRNSPVLLVSYSSDINDFFGLNATTEKEKPSSKGWVGGFIQANPELNYPQTVPDLSPLGPLTGNHDNIDKLDRMQRVRWPEFTWLRDKGDESTRLYLRFYDDISRIGYTKEGQVFSIICPQMGFDLNMVGLPGIANIEVHVGRCRGWVDEDTHTLCGDMTVTGKIWIEMTQEEREENPLVGMFEEELRAYGEKFPLTKETALTLPTHVVNKPYTNIIPVLNGTADFALPDFAQHWDREYCQKGTKSKVFAVGNVVCQVGNVPSSGCELVDEFNDILMNLQSIALGGILNPGSIITWNVWFSEPEDVDQEEWQSHSDRYRLSVDTHEERYTLRPSTMLDFNGNHVMEQVVMKELIERRALYNRILEFCEDSRHEYPDVVKSIKQAKRKIFRHMVRQVVLPALRNSLRKFLISPVLWAIGKPVSMIDRLVGRLIGFLLVGRRDPIPGVFPPRTGATNSLFRYLTLERQTIPLFFKYFFRYPRQILGVRFKLRSRLVPTDLRQMGVIGKPKTDDSFDRYKEQVTRVTRMREMMNKAEFNLPENYNFFPDLANAEEELVTVLKTNPLYASALTKEVGGDGFEVKSFDPDYDPEKDDSSRPWFLRLVSTLPKNNAGRRINVKFDSAMTKITSFQVFDEDGKSKTYDAQDPENKEILHDAIGKTQLNLLFYVSSVHVTIHILHTLMVQCFTLSSRSHDDMHLWSRWYNQNIMVMYRVQQIVTSSILSGGNGYGASRERIPILLKELLNSWGKSPKGFLNNMFNLTPKEMKDAGIMTEFFNHHSLVDGYVSEVCEVLQFENSIEYKDVVKETLRKLRTRCGDFHSRINTFEDWVYLMTVSGMFHGGTHTQARFTLAPYIMKWVNPDSKTWTKDDANIIGTYGVNGENNDDRNSMSSVRYKDISVYFRSVLEKYELWSNEMKEEYQEKLMNDPRLDYLGFILSDYCTDNFDFKQLSNASYN